MEMRLRLYFDELGQILFPLPPKEEQKAIADFLDKKLEYINSYISKQKKLIELLKEKKSSLINQAVTKGIDNSVEYVDSGIEWLGKIPKHWKVKKLKYIVSLKNGEPINKTDNGKYNLYGANGLIGKANKYNIFIEHIIIGRVGASGSINKAKEKSWISDNALIVFIKNEIEYEYLYNLLKALNLNTLATKNAQPLITSSLIKNLSVGITNLNEQKQIVNYIEKESKKIDDVISNIEDELELLDEYKQSIISSAVTGKIKVF
jgi:type I restriction enzyme S subunit